MKTKWYTLRGQTLIENAVFMAFLAIPILALLNLIPQAGSYLQRVTDAAQRHPLRLVASVEDVRWSGNCWDGSEICSSFSPLYSGDRVYGINESNGKIVALSPGASGEQPQHTCANVYRWRRGGTLYRSFSAPCEDGNYTLHNSPFGESILMVSGLSGQGGVARITLVYTVNGIRVRQSVDVSLVNGGQ